MPQFVGHVRLKTRVKFALAAEETSFAQEILEGLGGVGTRLKQDSFGAKGILFSQEELHNVVDDVGNERCKGCVEAVHLVHHSFQKMGHSGQNLVFQSLHLLFHD